MDILRPLTRADGLDSADFQAGCLLPVDKPIGWTSFDVVNKLRYSIRHGLAIKKIKVGHSGTLDPLATGLLLVCTGRWTRRIGELEGMDKTYIGMIRLGVTTDTYDAEGMVTSEVPYDHLTCARVQEVIASFHGMIEQVPPIYSAIKFKGQPLYKIARKGGQAEIKSREVEIHDIELTACQLPDIEIATRVSKGTYIRSLASDIGKALGCGAYLSALRRTAIGPYDIQGAWSLDDLVASINRKFDVQ